MLTAGRKCAAWPCKRCDRAGRTSWRSREQWHRERRAVWVHIVSLAGLLAGPLAFAVLMAVAAVCGGVSC